jgi:hypothetical protein
MQSPVIISTLKIIENQLNPYRILLVGFLKLSIVEIQAAARFILLFVQRVRVESFRHTWQIALASFHRGIIFVVSQQ